MLHRLLARYTPSRLRSLPDTFPDCVSHPKTQLVYLEYVRIQSLVCQRPEVLEDLAYQEVQGVQVAHLLQEVHPAQVAQWVRWDLARLPILAHHLEQNMEACSTA